MHCKCPALKWLITLRDSADCSPPVTLLWATHSLGYSHCGEFLSLQVPRGEFLVWRLSTSTGTPVSEKLLAHTYLTV